MNRSQWMLYFAWVMSCLSLLGSLYMSDVLHFEPCHLCWYQRICLYPLVIILGMAICRASTDVVPYLIPQIVIGACLSAYQIIIQEFPALQAIKLCGSGPSCTDKIDIGLGIISLPMMGMGVFIMIGWLLFKARKCATIAAAR